MERLLRATEAPAGIITNGHTFRLVSAPRAESSGWLDFKVAEMVTTAGRSILAAMRLLLSETRLLAAPTAERFSTLLEDSRKYQNEVSAKLAEQVLHALYELLRGFQSAHDRSGNRLLREPLDHHPDSIYQALLTVIMRLVFLLYSEERDMLPKDETFLRYYSVVGLHERLREDAALYPDTMGQRFGAWAQLLALFRIIHDGTGDGPMRLPARRGVLFDPERFAFLEGRTEADDVPHGQIEPPLVPDRNVYLALEKLLFLDGERISYRALDVEQLGSVYETMMGFQLETATGRSVAIRSQGKWGAATAVDLEALLSEPPAKRVKWVADRTDRTLTDKAGMAVKEAESIEALHAALVSVIDYAATPDIVPERAMVLQPSEERRRSGSHYTPRSLTEPIVRTALEPVLARLRGEDDRPPRPEQLLDLKLCDPAMGSGAFLVEACRQVGDELVESWHAYDQVPDIPSDEDEMIFARRLVAQRCLYGVDRNPMAVDLAKTSLWLATLAREHPLTFLAHALKHGDSLVGLTRMQIEAFHWAPADRSPQMGFESLGIRASLTRASETRELIRSAADTVPDDELRSLWADVEATTADIRLYGDLAIAAFFAGTNPKERETQRLVYSQAISDGHASRYRQELASQRHAGSTTGAIPLGDRIPRGLRPAKPGLRCHRWQSAVRWEEQRLGRQRCELHGLAEVGSPPKPRKCGPGSPLLPTLLRPCTNRRGVRAHRHEHDRPRRHAFDRASLDLPERRTIFAARKRVQWPGLAAVIVSVVHVIRGQSPQPPHLDGREVPAITAFLFHRGSSEDPVRLAENESGSYVGSYVLGMGFTFDDTDTKGVASSIAEMERLIAANPRNAEVIRPYIGGEELNSSPTQSHHRYVIDFSEASESQCRASWPELMEIVEGKVRPERMRQNDARAKRYWWQFIRPRPELRKAMQGLTYVLAISRVGQHAAIGRLPAGMVYSDSLIVFPQEDFAALGLLQSRVHETWARFFGSSMKDDLRYTPSDCFDTFPFPDGWQENDRLHGIGRQYADHRSHLMLARDEGLTDTYGQFHDPHDDDPDTVRLRELHGYLDLVVLDAYGWSDVSPTCEFLLDYAVDEATSDGKKKPWRYRWPDSTREDVLARLLELNGVRAGLDAA